MTKKKTSILCGAIMALTISATAFASTSTSPNGCYSVGFSNSGGYAYANASSSVATTSMKIALKSASNVELAAANVSGAPPRNINTDCQYASGVHAEGTFASSVAGKWTGTAY